MKRVIIFTLMFCSLTPVMASLSNELSLINDYVISYNSGELTASELIVYVDYVKAQMHGDEELISESEVLEVFGSTDNPELVLTTNDFDLVFFAHYHLDEEFYESKEGPTNYHIGYYLRPREPSFSDLSDELESFIQAFSVVVNNDSPITDELKNDFRDLKFKVRNLEGDCNTLMSSVFPEQEEHYNGVNYHTILRQSYREECWQDQNCTEVCEAHENCWMDCRWEEICEGGNGNESPDCRWEEFCEEVCESHEECHPECEPVTFCEDRPDGQVRVRGWCDDDGHTDLSVEAWSEELEHFNEVNEFDDHEGFSNFWVDSLVNVRRCFQESFNDEFVEWYFEDFIGDEPEKIVNGGDAIRRILDVLIWLEEDIVDALSGSDNKTWPSGFEEISIDYNASNVRLEVWEKDVPVDWFDNHKAWTTLYRYYFFPSNDSLKELILYQVSQHDTIGLGPDEIAEVKADTGRMELINRISERYGGSLDVNLRLVDEGEDLINKYVKINPDDVVGFYDESDSMDIGISVDYDSLYEFISYASTMEGDEIRGPHWVRIDNQGPSFGKIIGMIGALSKFWREGVTITPRHALVTLLFNFFDMLNLVQGLSSLGELRVMES